MDFGSLGNLARNAAGALISPGSLIARGIYDVFDPNTDLIKGVGPNEAARANARQQQPAGQPAPATAQQAQSGAYQGGASGTYAASAAANAQRAQAAAQAAAQNDTVRSLDDQANDLRNLLGRTDTGLIQGISRIDDDYRRELGGANASKEKALAGYEDKRVETNQGKLDSFGKIDRGANNGFRSLAQIIGRASGTGSSVFQDVLPDVIGKDTSGKRQEVVDTAGRNLQNVDKAQKQYELDFQGVLEDLLRQRQNNESSLRSGIEGQRQTINSQLSQNAASKAQAQGGGYDQVRAATQGYRDNINNSRNQVENFFNQFRTTYTPRQAVAAAPDLADYQVDRSTINAQNSGAADPNNPYASLLRKRIQEGAA